MNQLARLGALLMFTLGSVSALANSGVYGGGPIYKDANAISELKSSGFSHVVIWTIHIEQDGSLGFNGEFPLVENGVYIGDNTHPDFRNQVASLKTGTTSVTRVEFGLSGAGSGTYTAVRNLLACSEAHCGTGTSSILYRNFQALKNAFPTVDAVNNDDESDYHVDSAAPFHIMLSDIGFKTAIVPYTRKSFWQSFVSQVNAARPGAVDLLYLQGYAGGAFNNPCDWDLGLPVLHGLWSRDATPSQVQSQLQNFKNQCSETLQGGFMWLYDDFNNSANVANYANAINNVFSGTTPPATGVVELYQHCPFDGYKVPLEVGDYTLAELQAKGALDNDISSIKVTAGYQVEVFQHDSFGGYSWVVQNDDECINNNNEGRSDGSDWNDDITSVKVSKIDTPPPGNELQNGVPVSNLSGRRNAELRYVVNVPTGVTQLSITISGGSGDADLYVNKGSEPTVAAGSNNDCRPYIGGNNETCNGNQLSPLTAGTYHVMIQGYTSFSGVTLTATYN